MLNVRLSELKPKLSELKPRLSGLKPKRSELGATLSPLACGLGRVGQLTPELGHRQIEISLCNHGVQQLVPTPHQQFEA